MGAPNVTGNSALYIVLSVHFSNSVALPDVALLVFRTLYSFTQVPILCAKYVAKHKIASSAVTFSY
jgi:hypothetical protein